MDAMVSLNPTIEEKLALGFVRFRNPKTKFERHHLFVLHVVTNDSDTCKNQGIASESSFRVPNSQ